MPNNMTANSQTVPVNIVGSSIFGRFPKISSEKTFNMFISTAGQDEWLVNFAGWKKLFYLIEGSAHGRGVFHSVRNNIIVAVINNVVFKIDSDFNFTQVGTILTASGDVFMDENLNDQICIVDGLNAYIYNVDTGSLTKQTLNSNLIPNYVVYHNTFFIFGNANTTGNGAKWYVYVFDTPTTITEETELALETKPDYAIAVQRLPGQSNNIIVFGTSVSEIWTNVGGIDNYVRNSSRSIDYGCLSPSTIASNDRYVVWLGVNESNSPTITMFTEAGPVSISTDGIDYQLGQLQFPEQSTAFFYRDDGHLFYQITFYNPSDNLSLIYDMDTKKFFHISDAYTNYHPARNVVYFNNNVYFISLNNGAFYQTGTTFYTYDETIGVTPFYSEHNKEIPRTRITSSIRLPNAARFMSNDLSVTIDQGNDPNFMLANLTPTQTFLITEDSLDEIISETGLFLVSEDSILPQIYTYIPRVDLTISKDGGVTFSNTVSKDLRPIGYRKNMLRWTRQFGFSNDLTFKFRFWSKSYVCVWNGAVDIY